MNCCICKSSENLQKNGYLQYPDGRKIPKYICRDCSSKRRRKYLQTANGKAVHQQNSLLYKQRHPERPYAYGRARRIKAQPCEVCGATTRVHKHHDDITKPMDVIFLCPVHHAARHKELTERLQ